MSRESLKKASQLRKAFATALQGKVQSVFPCCFTALSPAVHQPLSPGCGGVNAAARLSELPHLAEGIMVCRSGRGPLGRRRELPWAVLRWMQVKPFPFPPAGLWGFPAHPPAFVFNLHGGCCAEKGSKKQPVLVGCDWF